MDMPKKIHFGNVFADDSETIETVEYIRADLVNELIEAVENWELMPDGSYDQDEAMEGVMVAKNKLKALEAE